MGAEADAEHGHALRQHLAHQRPFTRQERSALVVVGHQAAPEQHQSVHRDGFVGELLGQVRRVDDDGVDAVLDQPLRQAARPAARCVLHDDDARPASHGSILAAVSAVRSAKWQAARCPGAVLSVSAGDSVAQRTGTPS